jgi:hypothetical protein
MARADSRAPRGRLPLKQSDLLTRCRIGSSFSASPRPRARPLAVVVPVLTLSAGRGRSAGRNARGARVASRVAIFIISGNGMHAKWIVQRHAFIAEWLPLSGSTRLVTGKGSRRGYRLPGVLDKQRERWPYKAIRLTVLIARTRRASFDARHIELLHCAPDVDRERERERERGREREGEKPIKGDAILRDASSIHEMEKTKKIKGPSRHRRGIIRNSLFWFSGERGVLSFLFSPSF